jgi:hypothetical protein
MRGRRGKAAMTYQLLRQVSGKFQFLNILKSSSQVNKFICMWQDESDEVIECLADCIENHPDWLYGWLMSSEGSSHQAPMWLRFMIISNRPSLAVDHFSIFQETRFIVEAMECNPG